MEFIEEGYIYTKIIDLLTYKNIYNKDEVIMRTYYGNYTIHEVLQRGYIHPLDMDTISLDIIDNMTNINFYTVFAINFTLLYPIFKEAFTAIDFNKYTKHHIKDLKFINKYTRDMVNFRLNNDEYISRIIGGYVFEGKYPENISDMIKSNNQIYIETHGNLDYKKNISNLFKKWVYCKQLSDDKIVDLYAVYFPIIKNIIKYYDKLTNIKTDLLFTSIVYNCHFDKYNCVENVFKSYNVDVKVDDLTNHIDEKLDTSSIIYVICNIMFNHCNIKHYIHTIHKDYRYYIYNYHILQHSKAFKRSIDNIIFDILNKKLNLIVLNTSIPKEMLKLLMFFYIKHYGKSILDNTQETKNIIDELDTYLFNTMRSENISNIDIDFTNREPYSTFKNPKLLFDNFYKILDIVMLNYAIEVENILEKRPNYNNTPLFNNIRKLITFYFYDAEFNINTMCTKEMTVIVYTKIFNGTILDWTTYTNYKEKYDKFSEKYKQKSDLTKIIADITQTITKLNEENNSILETDKGKKADMQKKITEAEKQLKYYNDNKDKDTDYMNIVIDNFGMPDYNLTTFIQSINHKISYKEILSEKEIIDNFVNKLIVNPNTELLISKPYAYNLNYILQKLNIPAEHFINIKYFSHENFISMLYIIHNHLSEYYKKDNVINQESVYVSAVSEVISTQTDIMSVVNSLFWDGIEFSQYSKLSLGAIEILNKTCIPMLLYNDASGYTRCTLYKYDNSDYKILSNIKRICFLPLLENKKDTLYKRFMQISDEIVGKEEMEKIINKIKKKNSNESAAISKKGFDKFINDLDKWNSPLQVLLSYASIRKRNLQDTDYYNFKTMDDKFRYNIIKKLLTKLNYKYQETVTKSRNITTVTLKLDKQFNRLSLFNKIKEDKMYNILQKELVDLLIPNFWPLCISLGLESKQNISIKGGNIENGNIINENSIDVYLKNDIASYLNIIDDEYAKISNVDEFKNYDPFLDDKNFYKQQFLNDITNNVDFTTAVINNIPPHVFDKMDMCKNLEPYLQGGKTIIDLFNDINFDDGVATDEFNPIKMLVEGLKTPQIPGLGIVSSVNNKLSEIMQEFNQFNNDPILCKIKLLIAKINNLKCSDGIDDSVFEKVKELLYDYIKKRLEIYCYYINCSMTIEIFNTFSIYYDKEKLTDDHINLIMGYLKNKVGVYGRGAINTLKSILKSIYKEKKVPTEQDTTLDDLMNEMFSDDSI
jgi:hypothetical protein